MFWKNWPYWLKIGLLFVVIYIIFLSLFIISTKIGSGLPGQKVDLTKNGQAVYEQDPYSVLKTINGIIFLPTMFLTILPSIMLPTFTDTCMKQNTYMMPSFFACLDIDHFYFYELIIFQLILYFIAGAIIGWIYGKIKK